MPGVCSRRTTAGFVLAALVALCNVATAHAQIQIGNQWPNPRLTYLMPMGGKVGTTFEVSWGGSDLDEPQALWFSHPGIKGTPIVPPPPKPDPKADPKKPPPAPPPVTKFSVTINKDAPPGYYEARFVGKHGVSNPRVFVVGELNEVAEKEANNDVDQAQKVESGVTISGNLANATDVDYYSFPGKKGQRLTLVCLCASIDSRLLPELRVLDTSGKQLGYQRPLPGNDGVLDITLPADSDYLVRLNQFTYTQGNAEYFYRLSIASAPWIETVFPPMIEPGKTAALTLYGRNLPGGKPEPAAVVDGKPLDKLVVNVAAPGDPLAQQRLAFSGVVPPVSATLDGFEYRLPGSNPSLLTYAKAAVVLENEGNDSADKAQEIPVPSEVAGRIDKRGDRDWYAFSVKKGDTFIIELLSHRLGAPTDMFLFIRDMKAKPPQDVTSQDDNPQTFNTKNLHTASRDPVPFKFVAPADGKYHVYIGSHSAGLVADPTHLYRLRISPEKPDFRVIVMPNEDFRPDSVVLLQGGLETYNVFVERLEGFKGEVTLTLEGLPPGVTSTPQVLSANMKFVNLVVSAADNAPAFTGEIKVTGTAVINGQKVVREARPATVTWPVQPQQNIPTITRLDRQLMLAVREKAPAKLVATPDKTVAVMGNKVNIQLKLNRLSPEFKTNFQVQPVQGEFPTGVNFPNLTFALPKEEKKDAKKDEKKEEKKEKPKIEEKKDKPKGNPDEQTAVVTVAPNAQPGTYNLVFRGFAPIAPNPKAKPVNTILPSTPVTLTILPKQIATLTVDNANPTVKLGADGVVVVKLARLPDYNEAFKVDLVLPKEAKGISAEPITIPAGANEAKLTLKLESNTPPGQMQNLTIRAVAVVHGVTLTHETKINVTVVK